MRKVEGELPRDLWCPSRPPQIGRRLAHARLLLRLGWAPLLHFEHVFVPGTVSVFVRMAVASLGTYYYQG